MSTAEKLSPKPNALQLEEVLNDLVLAFNLRRLSILNRYQVNEMEVDIINFLNENEMKKMKEVGEHFSIKLSTLTSTIDKLEKNKLVKRKNSKEDRRVIYIRPTNKGEKLLADLDASMRKVSEHVTDSLKSSDFDALTKGLEAIKDFVNSQDGN